eukprot:CAMPEP_0175130010 /NCGR_PEP_ID=MMETSP0087-20121206/5780_1 /TAXON_ID=136419 /ORGANISM="Unknown Unknown, Strain D1" /LENGTH=92 /DNA_ID=CAMNT_0016412203 /DNA_START=46 /DNA_END=324 /DNA_ORIENTATION=-
MWVCSGVWVGQQAVDNRVLDISAVATLEYKCQVVWGIGFPGLGYKTRSNDPQVMVVELGWLGDCESGVNGRAFQDLRHGQDSAPPQRVVTEV